MAPELILDVRELRKSYGLSSSAFERDGSPSARQALAVEGVSFSLERGETLHCRRIRLRQDHARAPAPAAD